MDLAWHDESKKVFAQFPEYVKEIGQIDKFTIYEVVRAPTFFLKGSGSVVPSINCLELSEVVPEDGEIIIAYHWMEKLVAMPSATIEKSFHMDDPVGFIKIMNPPASLKLLVVY